VSRNYYNRGREWTKLGDIQTFNCPTAVGNQAEKGQRQSFDWMIVDPRSRRMKDGGPRIEDRGWRKQTIQTRACDC